MALAKKRFNFSEVEDESKQIDSIKVYLRVKPDDNPQNKERTSEFEVVDSNTLSVKSCRTSNKFSGRNEENRYIFTHIFSSNASQQEVFDRSVKETVVDFINGFSSLIFTYGTTNAGKTFTVQGTTEKPGLIPRTLHLVFNSIDDCQTDTLEYMPCGRVVKRMTELELKNQSELKDTLINGGHAEESHNTNKSGHKSCPLSQESGFDFKTLDLTLAKEKESSVPLKPDCTYSLWISFYEIYNECIYDLLTPPLTSRKQLKLGEDSAKNSFVKELKYVNVTTVKEALRVLLYGRNNSQVAVTGLNAQSSRSHCIFTLTLVCSPKTGALGEEIVISQLSLCDLAGTERQKKTLNVGERLKESQHINCSLHVLSRCFEIIRENQNRPDRSVIPYRESKLTKLFQKAFRCEEKIVMLVNINLAFSLDDTHQVLKTSAIARKTTTSIKPWQQTKRRSRSLMFRRSLVDHSQNKPLRNMFSSPASLARGTLAEADEEEEEEDDVSDVHGHSQQIVESLLSTIESQKKKMTSLKSRVEELESVNANLEDELRAELAFEYGKLIKTIEGRLKKRIEDQNQVIAGRDKVIADLERRVNCNVDYEEKCASSRKKRKVFDCSLSMIEAANNSDVIEIDADVLKEENNLLKNDISSLKSTLTYYKNENAELNKKYAEMKLLRRIENIATLREAVVDENIQRVLEEMDRMKEKYEAELSNRGMLLKEAMDEMSHLEATYEEVLNDIGRLEGELLLARDRLEEVERTLEIANEISAKKSEENHQMEMKLENLECDNEKLNDYIELADAEIKCLREKLMLVERNRTMSADIFEDSLKKNEERETMFQEKFELTNQDSLSSTRLVQREENFQNVLCKTLQNDSLEFGTLGVEGGGGDVDSMAFHSSSINSTNGSITKQSVELALQSSVSNANVCDTFANSKSESLGEIANDSLSLRSKTVREEELPEMEVKIEMEQKIIEMTNDIDKIKQCNHSLIQLVDQNREEKMRLENEIRRLIEEKAKLEEKSEDDRNLEISQLTNEISKVNLSNLTLKSLVEQSESEKMHLQEEMERLRNEIVESKSQFHQKLSELSFQINEIKNFHSTTINLLENFKKKKTFYHETLEKLSVVNEKQEADNKQLRDAIRMKDVEVEQLVAQRKSVLESDEQELHDKINDLQKNCSEMEEMVLALKISNDKLSSCNTEYTEKNKKLLEELELKNEALCDLEAKHQQLMNEVTSGENFNKENKQLIEERENLLQKLNILEADHERLMIEMETTKSSHKEYVEKNQELIEELESKDEKYESLLEKLNSLEANHERLTIEMDTAKTSNRDIAGENKKLIEELGSKDKESKEILQKLNNLEANHERLTIEMETTKSLNKEYVEKNQELLDELESKHEKYESLLSEFNNLKANQQRVMEADHGRLTIEMETTKSLNREYVEKNQELLEELESRDEKYESLLEKLKNLEANHERLTIEMETTKSSNKEYVERNQELIEELKSKDEKYERLLEKLNNVKANQQRVMNEVDTKENHLRQVENELRAAKKDLEMKTEEIKKLDELIRTRKSVSIKSTSDKTQKTPSRLKSKAESEHSDEMDDVFFTPSHRENNENRAPANTGTERPLRNTRNKTCDPNQKKTLIPKSTAKRVTRSKAQTSKSASSPPHAQLLNNTQSSQHGRRLLAQPQIQIEEFPDDPQVLDESPVSTLNRLTGTPLAQQRQLRTRRKKQF